MSGCFWYCVTETCVLLQQTFSGAVTCAYTSCRFTRTLVAKDRCRTSVNRPWLCTTHYASLQGLGDVPVVVCGDLNTFASPTLRHTLLSGWCDAAEQARVAELRGHSFAGTGIDCFLEQHRLRGVPRCPHLRCCRPAAFASRLLPSVESFANSCTWNCLLRCRTCGPDFYDEVHPRRR